MGTLPSRSHHLLGHAGARAALVVAACGALQCTYDFDRFDPAAAVAQGGAAGQNTSLSDAAAGEPMADQSAGSVDAPTGTADAPIADASSASDAVAAPEASSDAGCGTSCFGTAKTCAATCTSTSDACVAKCTRSSCKTMCMMARDTCVLACVSTCQMCTRDAGCPSNPMLCTAAAR